MPGSHRDERPRQEQIEALVQQYRDRLEQAWPTDDPDVSRIEDLAGRLGQDVQREIVEKLLQEEATRTEGNQTSCPCGHRARYKRDAALEGVTAAGRVPVRRSYYCVQCRKGHCPADTRLGLGPACRFTSIWNCTPGPVKPGPYRRVTNSGTPGFRFDPRRSIATHA